MILLRPIFIVVFLLPIQYAWSQQSIVADYVKSADSLLVAGKIEQALLIYDSASMIMPSVEDFDLKIKTAVSAIPADTILWNEGSPGYRQLFRRDAGKEVFFTKFSKFSDFQHDTLYLCKDSSLFSGIVLNEQKKDPKGEYVVSAHQYREGNSINKISYAFCDTLSTVHSPLFPYYGQKSIHNWSGRSCRISGYDFRLSFYPNGDTSEYYRLSRDGSTLEIHFYPNHDTASYSAKRVINGKIISREYSYKPNGNRSFWDRELESLVDHREKWFRYYSLNATADTIGYAYYVNKQAEGKMIENLGDGKLLVRLQWKEGKLVDISNSNLIYMDQKHKIIEKAEFIRKKNDPNKGHRCQLRFLKLEESIVTEAGQTYEIVAYLTDINVIYEFSGSPKDKSIALKRQEKLRQYARKVG